MMSKIVHFKFLDAFRGLMALSVVVAHSKRDLNPFDPHRDFVLIIQDLTSPLGMSGFFLLSSFLLTYRLYDELNKISSWDWNEHALSIGKYFIRRFMRVYLVYFVFCTLTSFMSVFSTGMCIQFLVNLQISLLCLV